MREAVIVSYARTGLAKSGRGGFNITPPMSIAAHAIKHAVERAGVDKEYVEDCYLGNCAHGAPNIGRQAALLVGMPKSTELGPRHQARGGARRCRQGICRRLLPRQLRAWRAQYRPPGSTARGHAEIDRARPTPSSTRWSAPVSTRNMSKTATSAIARMARPISAARQHCSWACRNRPSSAHAIKHAVERAGVDKEYVEDCYLGNCAHGAPNIGRQAALLVGMPKSTELGPRHQARGGARRCRQGICRRLLPRQLRAWRAQYRPPGSTARGHAEID